MKRGIVTFDLESALVVLEEGHMVGAASLVTDAMISGPIADLINAWPGISCAALCVQDYDSDEKQIEFFESAVGKQAMSAKQASELFWRLIELSSDYDIVTWNGTKFDFQVLGQHVRGDEAKAKLKEMTWRHIDMMLMVTCTKGWYLSLDKALEGIGLSKQHNVTLSDGFELLDMHGGMAPLLWAQGERKAVLEYLQGDVEYLMELAMSVNKYGRMGWISGSGRRQSITMPLTSVYDCLELPTPDTSWMDNPPQRQDFVNWMETI